MVTGSAARSPGGSHQARCPDNRRRQARTTARAAVGRESVGIASPTEYPLGGVSIVDAGLQVPGVKSRDRQSATIFKPQDVRVSGERAFAYRVRGPIRHAEDGYARCHVDNMTGAGKQIRERGRRGVPGAEQVDLYHFPGVLVGWLTRTLGPAQSRVVNQNVDAAQLSAGLLDCAGDLVRLGDISADESGASTQVRAERGGRSMPTTCAPASLRTVAVAVAMPRPPAAPVRMTRAWLTLIPRRTWDIVIPYRRDKRSMIDRKSTRL